MGAGAVVVVGGVVVAAGAAEIAAIVETAGTAGKLLGTGQIESARVLAGRLLPFKNSCLELLRQNERETGMARARGVAPSWFARRRLSAWDRGRATFRPVTCLKH